MTELRSLTLKGTFLTHIARGETQVPLGTAVKTARTYVRKGYVSPSALAAVVGEAQTAGVEAFKDWASYDERHHRFQALSEALAVVLAEGSAERRIRTLVDEAHSIVPPPSTDRPAELR